MSTPSYNQDMVGKTLNYVNEHFYVQDLDPENIAGLRPIRTGCPVMRAKTKD